MYIDVAIPVPLHTAFTYRVPDGLAPKAGMRVCVPFRRKERIGMVLRTNATPPPGVRCQDVIACCDPQPLLDATLLTLCEWMSGYYAAPIGEVCQATLPAPFWRTAKLPGASRGGPAHRGDPDCPGTPVITLTAHQRAAVDTVVVTMQQRTFGTFLLHGITGSGKTEVYLEIMAHALQAGQQALLLLPEIGLTPQLLGKIRERFGDQVALYHSGLTDAQRMEQWWRMQRGEARVCCGTRSAVFAPFANLGCLILDEEHDGAYKQEDSPRYHARDVAVVRAKSINAVAVLGSATPSLESFHNVERKKYVYLALPERPTRHALPTVELVDMRKQPSSNDVSGLLSEPLRTAIAVTLDSGEQTLLFLNRRGFANVLLCGDCGHVFRCANCEISLTLHKQARRLRCHYCDFALPRPTQCPACQGRFLKAVGSGTERIETALTEHFPAARIARLDRDTTARRGARDTIVRDVKRGRVDILLGTQMITKGHDFPRVTLVGVIQADLSLYMPDFRAAERTFQLLTQVAGRAGRAELPGRVFIQTYNPEHYSLLCAQTHDYARFVATEVGHRKGLHYPPFGKLINVRCSGNQEAEVSRYATTLRDDLDRMLRGGTTSTGILGPVPAPLAKVAGKHRWQLLLKIGNATQSTRLAQIVQDHATAHAPRGVHVAIDVDPVNML